MKITKDLNAISKGSFTKAIATIITNPCFHSVCLFRLASLLYKCHLSPLAKLIWYINRVFYSVDIDYRADLAGGLVLVHGLGVVIGGGVVSKGKLVVFQQVTIGGSMNKHKTIQGKEMWQPYIEDNVTLYTKSSLFGPVYIPANTTVKAGRMITEKECVECNETYIRSPKKQI